jgi:hypothetical protein
MSQQMMDEEEEEDADDILTAVADDTAAFTTPQDDDDDDEEFLREPIWTGGTEVASQLDAVVRQPLTQPELFDVVLLPVRRLVAMWAPTGSGKRTALIEYCTTLLYDAYAVVCASDTRGTLPEALEMRKAAAPRSRPVRVVVVENADELVQYTAHGSYALRLNELAVRLNVIMLCLFDRIITQEHGAFLDQFATANIYFPPPNSMFLRGFLKYWMERYQRRYPKLVVISLTDGDYVALASEHARDAPIAAVHAWLRSIFYPVIAKAKEGDPIEVNMTELTSPPYMTTSAKGAADPYILPRDPRMALNEFTVMVGMGPIYVMPKKKRIVKEDGEADDIKVRLTDPTVETLTGDYAATEGGGVEPDAKKAKSNETSTEGGYLPAE